MVRPTSTSPSTLTLILSYLLTFCSRSKAPPRPQWPISTFPLTFPYRKCVKILLLLTSSCRASPSHYLHYSCFYLQLCQQMLMMKDGNKRRRNPLIAEQGGIETRLLMAAWKKALHSLCWKPISHFDCPRSECLFVWIRLLLYFVGNCCMHSYRAAVFPKLIWLQNMALRTFHALMFTTVQCVFI